MIRSQSENKMNVTKKVKFEKEANEDKGSTSQAMAKEDPQDITEIALTLAKDAITAAVKSVEEAENPVRNIDWITHGEFTEEKGLKQVEEFVSRNQVKLVEANSRSLEEVSGCLCSSAFCAPKARVRGGLLNLMNISSFQGLVLRLKGATRLVWTRGVIKNWEYQGRWEHYTEFLRREDVFHSFYYIYCVRWSIPTARRPIAQITASVYFTIKVNKNKPPDTPIDVSYVFEGHSLVHRPGMIRFREKWLRDIIEAKCVLINPNIFQFNSIGVFQNILGDF